MPRRSIVFSLSLLVALALAPAAARADNERITVHDNCEPASFNFVIGDGTCVGSGTVTFGVFASFLNPAAGGHPDWNFAPRSLALERGDDLRARNRGGETHSVTEVKNFGTGFVPPLNAALPPGTAAAVPVDPANLSFIAPGARLRVKGLAPGTHLFECLIHPWMRATVTVEEDD